ncbi:hypothetical protein LZQ00_03650 [Sphingobacterium sp. SRCM116780]|uniref:hypothetical protein n=1 Tax=Sphingobacterium sp. SRCM116780 TaxID=2907623 RepID=UPI001F334915|nr:hypothetical protein [Sphingobacterium sp. SRCM116780]UIR56915.1 hypothetical protein LZQ00_03650 [Sphingobacterium sp. SRCM116780]
MSGLWNRFVGDKTVKISRQEWKDQAELSYLSSQIDTELIKRCTQKIASEPENETLLQSFLNYQRAALQQDRILSVASEIDFLEQYVSLFQYVSTADISIIWTKNIAYPTLPIPSFILVPLIQNALFKGYHTAEKYPMKIKISVSEKVISLDISNHVNHHVTDQKVSDLLTYYQARLHHEFGEQHTLIMNSNAHTFRSHLTLRFK